MSRFGLTVNRYKPRTSTSTLTHLLNYEVWRWGKREIIYLSLHCHHQNDSCIKMGSNESHFNVSLIVRNKVIRRCPQTSTFSKRKESRSGTEARSFFLPAYNALPLGQTGSLIKALGVSVYRPQRLHMAYIVQELCESRGGRPGLSVLTSLLVSVAVKIYCTMLRHWSQLVPNIVS